MLVSSILLIVFAVVSLFASTLVFMARNLSWLVRSSFAGSVLSLLFWYVSLYLSNVNFSQTLFFNRIVYVWPVIALVSFGLFMSGAFIVETKKISAINKISIAVAIPIVLIGATALNVRAIQPRYSKGVISGYSIVPGSLNFGVSVGLLILIILLVRHSYMVYKQADKKNRRPLLLTIISLVLNLVVSSVTNIVTPSLRHGSSVANILSNLTTLFFVATMTYCVFRYRFLNIRLIVVRSVAYLATLVVLASVFGFVVFGIAVGAFDLRISVWTQVYISVATAIAALGFGSLKSFFDKVSNKLFYRDAYDGQELLDRLNRLFVSNTDLEPLLKESASIIETELKTEFCFFGIRESDRTPQRVIGKNIQAIRDVDVAAVKEITPHMHSKLIVTEAIDETHEQLRSILEANHIALLGRLVASVKPGVEGLGYLVLGPRRSGNPYTKRDLRVLEIIVNELVIAIENSLRFEQIQNFNETLQANVNDATRKLRRTNDKLQALDTTKDEFITMASHQLRTPLTSVKGYLSMVLEGDAGKLNAQQTQLLAQSYVSAQRMVFLISDLLNLSRLNTGKFIIEPTPVDLRDIVKAEIDQLRETANSREVTLHYDDPETLPKLMLDETKIHQVVMNFIDNAIYYTPAGGAITITLKETPAAVEYRVKDNGIGVPKRDQHKLFAKFYRASNAQSVRPDGTGLGLFMAKKVVAAQGGSILFESQEGKGSTFGFRFSKAHHLVPTVPVDNPPEKITTT